MLFFKMASRRCVFEEELWKKAFLEVKNQFEIDNIYPEQEQAVRSFFERGNVFVNLPTGYGKSMAFQCLPIVADVLFERPRGTSVVMVISPLKSLMEDQVAFLGDVGIPAVAINNDTDADILQQVVNGTFSVVFGSPECFLSTAYWRGVFEDSGFKEILIGVAVDEAHCITQWGISGSKKIPFRKWYGCLGELSSVIAKSCNTMVLTATATKTSIKQILQTLNLCSSDVVFIQESPDRPNLHFVKQLLDNNDPLEKVFGHLIHEVSENGRNTERTIIYCQTRKQCSVLFRMFEVFLGKKMFLNTAKCRPQERLVDMYHAGTPENVKSHISTNMADENGHLRVLISTVAFGMGVNCKQIRRVIHFGPSKSIEQYIQECGRAGRDGLDSTCILLHNGMLSVFCENDMKEYLQEEGCLRKSLMVHFEVPSKAKLFNELHECCFNCAVKCECSASLDCQNNYWKPSTALGMKNSPSCKHHFTRTVSDMEKEELKKQLVEMQKDLKKNMCTEKFVSYPHVIMEFNRFQINQVLRHCTELFNVYDICKHVEIWRRHYAIAILKVFGNVFHDIDIDELYTIADDINESVHSGWGEIRDDSGLIDMIDSQYLEEMDTLSDSIASLSMDLS